MGFERGGRDDLVTVRLLHCPLALNATALGVFDRLMRELARVSMQPGDDQARVAARLLELFASVSQDYAGVTAPTDLERDAALADGVEYADLVYEAPARGRDDAITLLGLLEEADELCRSTPELAALAAPADVLAFRHWYFGQFIDQLAGLPPTPWPPPPA